MFDGVIDLKHIFILIGGFLIYLGSMLEPSASVWVISIGGSLLTASLGLDRPIVRIIIHIIIGLFWGIFGSQILHAEFTFFPQTALAFFMSMFGVELTWFCLRTIQEGSFTEFIVSVLGAIIPSWLKGPKSK